MEHHKSDNCITMPLTLNDSYFVRTNPANTEWSNANA